jgi:hypothetical protein
MTDSSWYVPAGLETPGEEAESLNCIFLQFVAKIYNSSLFCPIAKTLKVGYI